MNFERILSDYGRFRDELAQSKNRHSISIQIFSFLVAALAISTPPIVLILMYPSNQIFRVAVAFVSVTTAYFLIAILHPWLFRICEQLTSNWHKIYFSDARSESEPISSVPIIDLAWLEEVRDRRINNIKLSENLGELARRTASAIAERFNPENAAVFMPDQSRKRFTIMAGFGFTHGERESLTLEQDSPLIKKFHEGKIMLVKSRLDETYGSRECQELRKEMDRIHCELSLPLRLENGTVYAIISIGPKKYEGQRDRGPAFREHMN